MAEYLNPTGLHDRAPDGWQGRAEVVAGEGGRARYWSALRVSSRWIIRP
jgi:hypothetical protein